jgi:hypothetical protein
LLSIFFYYASSGQRTKIDELEKTLPSLHDSVRIDCLNVLSLAYTYLHPDTAKSYAQKAYTESLVINYWKGMVVALNNEARIAGLGFHDFQLQEKISLQAIQYTLEDEQNL